MLRKPRYLLLVVAIACCFSSSATFAQPPTLPAPVQQPGGPLPPIPVPRYESLPPSANNPFLPATPLGPSCPAGQFSPCPAAQCGYYGLFEISLLFPEMRGMLSGPVTVTGLPPTTVMLGSASLDATGSPRFEIGYRFGDDLGAVAVAYRSIVSKGGDNAPSISQFGNPFLNSLINFNIVDIDYVSPAYNLLPFWNFSWRAGIRTAGAYYKNQLIGTLGQQEATSNFLGAGPHAELELGRALEIIPGLAVLAKIDGAILVGNIAQSFSETLQTTPPIGGASVFNSTETVPVLTFDLGLSYTPPGSLNWARFGLGYQFEYWWDVGSSGNSHGNLLINGIYFRGEFNF
jgi:Legionella pneumophila major outer membrane protein precursor